MCNLSSDIQHLSSDFQHFYDRHYCGALFVLIARKHEEARECKVVWHSQKKQDTFIKIQIWGGEGGNKVSNEWLWTKEGLEEQNQWVLIITLVEAPFPLVTTHQAWHW
jgi:hypothetical protein